MRIGEAWLASARRGIGDVRMRDRSEAGPPIIEQATVRCPHRDTVDGLVLAAAMRWHLDDRVLV